MPIVLRCAQLSAQGYRTVAARWQCHQPQTARPLPTRNDRVPCQHAAQRAASLRRLLHTALQREVLQKGGRNYSN